MSRGPAGHLVASEAGHHAHAHGDRMAVLIALHRGNERRFPGRAATPALTVPFAAPVRIIHLHDAPQRPRIVTFLHGLHQLVLEQPRRVVRHPELALE